MESHPFGSAMLGEMPDGGRLEVTDPTLTELDGGGRVPRQVTYRHDGDDQQPARELVFEVRNGKPVCVTITLTTGAETGLRATDLSGLRLEKLAASAVTWFGVLRPNPRGRGEVLVMGRKARSDDRSQAEKARQRRHIDDKLLRRVADVWAAAEDRRRVAAVREQFHVEERQALRYIAKARERGFITEQGSSNDA